MSAPSDPSETFLLAEYKVISQNFSSAFHTMAVLLTLFFLYTAAALSYISHIFDNIKPSVDSDQVWILLHIDFRYLQILVICLISEIFTFWSHCWVSVYSSGARMTLLRASALERQLSQSDGCTSFFCSYAAWYNSERWLIRLYYATRAFFASVYVLYFLIVIYAAVKLLLSI